MALHFSKEEFSKRKQSVLKSMKEQNLDALLMFRQESMYWLTGYDTFGYVFFQTLVLDQSGNVILLTRAPDLRQAQNTSNIEDIRIWVDKDGTNPTDDLKKILNELNLKNKTLRNIPNPKERSIWKVTFPSWPIAGSISPNIKFYQGHFWAQSAILNVYFDDKKNPMLGPTMPKNVVPSIGFFFKQNVFCGTTWDAVLTPSTGSKLSILEFVERR